MLQPHPGGRALAGAAREHDGQQHRGGQRDTAAGHCRRKQREDDRRQDQRHIGGEGEQLDQDAAIPAAARRIAQTSPGTMSSPDHDLHGDETSRLSPPLFVKELVQNVVAPSPAIFR